jgi:hypothetical protein
LVYNSTRNTFDFSTAIGVGASWYRFGAGSRFGVVMGSGALDSYTGTADAYNVAIGYSAIGTNTTGVQNTIVGGFAAYSSAGAASNITAIGYGSLNLNTGSGNTALGWSAGKYNTSATNQIFINSLDRTNYAGDQNGSPIYVQQNATVASQIVTLNGSVGINTTSPGYTLGITQAKALINLTSSTTTNETYLRILNGGGAGATYLGNESSAGGNIITGTLAYATVLANSGSTLKSEYREL